MFSIEKRYIFTIDDLDTIAPSYEFFVAKLDELIKIWKWGIWGSYQDQSNWPNSKEFIKIWEIDQNQLNWSKFTELIKIHGIDQNLRNRSNPKNLSKCKKFNKIWIICQNFKELIQIQGNKSNLRKFPKSEELIEIFGIDRNLWS